MLVLSRKWDFASFRWFEKKCKKRPIRCQVVWICKLLDLFKKKMPAARAFADRYRVKNQELTFGDNPPKRFANFLKKHNARKTGICSRF